VLCVLAVVGTVEGAVDTGAEDDTGGAELAVAVTVTGGRVMVLRIVVEAVSVSVGPGTVAVVVSVWVSVTVTGAGSGHDRVAPSEVHSTVLVEDAAEAET
jgi:hypothetical protein